MRNLFDEYGDMILNMIGGMAFLGMFMFFLSYSLTSGTSGFDVRESVVAYDDGRRDCIELFEVEDMVFMKGEKDISEPVIAINDLGEDISAFVSRDHVIDTSKAGDRTLVYTIAYNGEYISKEVRYHVYEDETDDSTDEGEVMSDESNV